MMKSTSIAILGITLSGGLTFASPTAKQAVVTLGREKGTGYADNIVQIVGIQGGDQPKVWRILARDPYQYGAIRDFAVQENRVVGDQFVPPAYHRQIPALVVPSSALKTDSSEAFIIADKAASEAKVGFDSLDYEMLGSDPSTGPVWVVRLVGRSGLMVGELVIRGRDGQMLRKKWFPQGVELARNKVKPSGASRNVAMRQAFSEGWGKTKKGFSRGSEAVKEGVSKAGNSVKGFFDNVFKRRPEQPQQQQWNQSSQQRGGDYRYGNPGGGAGARRQPNYYAPGSGPQYQRSNGSNRYY